MRLFTTSYLTTLLMFTTGTLFSDPFYRIIIHNASQEILHASYRRPDPGFKGMHVIVNDTCVLKPDEHEMIMVSTKESTVTLILRTVHGTYLESHHLQISHNSPPILRIKNDYNLYLENTMS